MKHAASQPGLRESLESIHYRARSASMGSPEHFSSLFPGDVEVSDLLGPTAGYAPMHQSQYPQAPPCPAPEYVAPKAPPAPPVAQSFTDSAASRTLPGAIAGVLRQAGRPLAVEEVCMSVEGVYAGLRTPDGKKYKGSVKRAVLSSLCATGLFQRSSVAGKDGANIDVWTVNEVEMQAYEQRQAQRCAALLASRSSSNKSNRKRSRDATDSGVKEPSEKPEAKQRYVWQHIGENIYSTVSSFLTKGADMIPRDMLPKSLMPKGASMEATNLGDDVYIDLQGLEAPCSEEERIIKIIVEWWLKGKESPEVVKEFCAENVELNANSKNDGVPTTGRFQGKEKVYDWFKLVREVIKFDRIRFYDYASAHGTVYFTVDWSGTWNPTSEQMEHKAMFKVKLEGNKIVDMDVAWKMGNMAGDHPLAALQKTFAA